MSKADTIAFLGHMQHLRPEGGADKLPVRRVRDRLQHLSHRRPVLGVKVGVDFVEKVEWSGVAGLDGEYEGKGTKT